MNAAVSYGPGLPDESTLKLCGDLSGGKRALELGISDEFNSLAFAAAGGKAIAVDLDTDKIAELRSRAAAQELHVECHGGDLADLGFATSGSIEVALVVGNQLMTQVDDPSRLFRQVHRVLRPEGPLVIACDHPYAAVHRGAVARYGDGAPTVSDWFVQLHRTNFRVDVLHELGVGDDSPAPTTLILRARKEGY